jgi:hypothetical protein
MQQTIINKTTSLTVIQNLDLSGLRSKINDIQERVYDLININQNNIINNKKLGNTLNNSIKSNYYNSYDNINTKENQNPDIQNERIW